jgi:hypothetical protein
VTARTQPYTTIAAAEREYASPLTGLQEPSHGPIRRDVCFASRRYHFDRAWLTRGHWRAPKPPSHDPEVGLPARLIRYRARPYVFRAFGGLTQCATMLVGLVLSLSEFWSAPRGF